jgi:hypothetical protein
MGRTYNTNEGGAYQILVGKPGGKRPLEDVGVDGRIILRWILKIYVARLWT